MSKINRDLNKNNIEIKELNKNIKELNKNIEALSNRKVSSKFAQNIVTMWAYIISSISLVSTWVLALRNDKSKATVYMVILISVIVFSSIISIYFLLKNDK